jgi:hypothetical protein
MSIPNYSGTIKDKFSALLNGKAEINIDIFLHPDRHVICLPVEEIVADSKVSRKGIKYYKQKISSNEPINPLIVVKHPKKGSVRCFGWSSPLLSFFELGRTKIDCALAGNNLAHN